MLQQRKVRNAETPGVEVGRELLEDELAAICGGSQSSGNSTGTDFEDPYGLSTLANLLNPQAAAAPSKNKNNSLPNFNSLGALSGLTSGLFGKLI